jgi:hypothetical protein
MNARKLSVTVLALFALLIISLPAACRQDLPAQSEPSETTAQAKDTKPIVEGIIEAYGGKDAITKVKNVFAKGPIRAFMRQDNGTYTRHMALDRKLRVDIRYTQSSELRILNGSEGWRGENKGALNKVEGFQYLAMVYQYNQLNIPYGLIKDQYDVKWIGEAEVEGSQTDILALSGEDGPAMEIYVDRNDHRILKTSGFFDFGGQRVDLTAEFAEFKKVHGVLFPFKITNYSEGFKLGETDLKEVRVNVRMKDSLFRP